MLLRRDLASALARPVALASAVALTGLLLGCGDSKPAAAPAGQAAAAAAPVATAAPAAAAPRRTLPHGQAATAGQAALDRLTKIDLAQEQSSGNLTVEANDPAFTPRFSVLIDGDVKSMTRSEGVNPLILTLTFREPKTIAAARIFPAGSSYDWLIEPTPGGPRPMLEAVPDSAWSQIDLDPPQATSVVRLEILRRERDDFVHVNEIELYSKP